MQKAPAATVGDVALAMKQLYGYQGDITVIGIRNGEKMHETLLTREEMTVAIESDRYFQIPAPQNNLNYDQFLSEGVPQRIQVEEYNSENTRRLSISEIINLLKFIGYQGQPS